MRNKQLSKIFLTIAAVLVLLPIAYTFVLSFKNYTPLRGIAGSPWVGFANYAKAVTTPHFLQIFKNSAIIGILSLVAGALYVFAASAAAGSISSRPLKALVALVFCLPSIIPSNLFVTIIPQNILINPSFLLQLTVGVVDGLRLSGLVIIAAIFIKGDIIKESIKCALLFSAIRLMSLFTADSTVLTSIYNPLTYEVLDTLTSYTYRTGIMNGDGSVAATMHIVKTLLQLLPAAFGVVITAAIFKREPKAAIGKIAYPALAAAIIPLAIFAVTVMQGISSDSQPLPDIFINSYINGIIIAAVSALALAALSCVLSQLVRNSGMYGFVISALLITSANSIIGNYLIIRSLHLANTPFGVILQNLSLVPIMLLVFAYATKLHENIMPVILAGIGICFAWFWGDTMAPMIMLNNRELYPVSLMFREVILSAGKSVSALWYIAVPLAVSAVGIFFAARLSKE